jgi:hypothetical protein
MPKIRIRYPLLLILFSALYYTVISTESFPQSKPSLMQSIPKLEPGYYLLLHAAAKLPKDIPAHYEKDATYIGPLPTIKVCHQYRVKIKPLYPGVVTDLVKINAISLGS